MKDVNFRNGDAKTAIFGSEEMLQPSPVDKIPDGPTTPQIAYQMVKDETYAQPKNLDIHAITWHWLSYYMQISYLQVYVRQYKKQSALSDPYS